MECIRQSRRSAFSPRAFWGWLRAAVRGVHAVALAEGRGGGEQRRPRPPEPVQQQNVGAVTHRQRRDVVAADRDVVNLQQRGPALREAEHSLEADGVVEVAVDAQLAALEGVPYAAAFASGLSCR